MSTMPSRGRQPHHYDPFGRTPDAVRLEAFFEHYVEHADTDTLRVLREQAEVEAFCVSGLGHRVRNEDLGGRGTSFYCEDCDTDLDALFALNPQEP